MPYTYQKKYRLADIYIPYWSKYIKSPSRKLYLTEKHFKAVNSAISCRTSRMGYHYFKCKQCGDVKNIYHSCKHRFCATCGVKETYRWAENRLSGLLKMKHYHVTFTLPAELRHLSRINENLLHDLLFKNSQMVLQDWFNHTHGIKCGIISVLHTAGSDLKYHPHVHMIVSGGGIDPLTGEWKELPGKFLVDHCMIREKFRDCFLKSLNKLYDKGLLQLYGGLSLGKGHFRKFINKLSNIDWIMSIQPPLQDHEMIIKYIGRYTKRACMSEYRLQSINQGIISYSFKDYKNSDREGPVKESSINLRVNAFLDRLLLHVPEPGYRMVRNYGLYSNYYSKIIRGDKIEPAASEDEGSFTDFKDFWYEIYNEEPLYCKKCGRPYSYMGEHFIIRKNDLPVSDQYQNTG